MDCVCNPSSGRRLSLSSGDDDSSYIQALVTLPLTIPHIHAIFADSSVERVVVPYNVSVYMRAALFYQPTEDSADPVGLLPLPPTGDSDTCMPTSALTKVDSCIRYASASSCASHYMEIMDGVLSACTTLNATHCKRVTSVSTECEASDNNNK